MAEDTYEVDEIVEDLHKKPKAVKTLLKDMKNISELMVDLAYSAVLFNSDALAEEVKDLEEEMNKLRYQVEIKAMLSARTEEDAAKLLGLMQVATAAERISNAAESLSELVLRDIEPHPVLQAALEEADEIVDRITVKKNSWLAKKKVGSIRREISHGFDIICIKRGNSWLFKVDDSSKIEENDILIVAGFKEAIGQLNKKRK